MPWVIVDKTLLHIDDTYPAIDAAITHIITYCLSPVAYAILRDAPPDFRNGHPVSSRAMAARTGYADSKQIISGYRELVGYGFVRTIPFGRTRRQYIGVPSMMWSAPVKRLFSPSETFLMRYRRFPAS